MQIIEAQAAPTDSKSKWTAHMLTRLNLSTTVLRISIHCQHDAPGVSLKEPKKAGGHESAVVLERSAVANRPVDPSIQ